MVRQPHTETFSFAAPRLRFAFCATRINLDTRECGVEIVQGADWCTVRPRGWRNESRELVRGLRARVH